MNTDPTRPQPHPAEASAASGGMTREEVLAVIDGTRAGTLDAADKARRYISSRKDAETMDAAAAQLTETYDAIEAVYAERDKLRAVLDGAEYRGIDELLTRTTIADCRRLGEMAKESTLAYIAERNAERTRAEQAEAANVALRAERDALKRAIDREHAARLSESSIRNEAQGEERKELLAWVRAEYDSAHRYIEQYEPGRGAGGLDPAEVLKRDMLGRIETALSTNTPTGGEDTSP